VPELPEVETIRRSLNARLVGRRVDRVTVGTLPLRLPLDPEAWRTLVVGARMEDLTRRGKYLLAWWGQAVSVLHLGMSGRLLARPYGSTLPPHTHLIVHFDGGVDLLLVDPRRFGLAAVMPRRELAGFASLSALGVDPLDGPLEAALTAAAQRSRVAIRNLLVDQHIVAGLGNIYANEALARAGVRPTRPANTVSRRRLSVLATAIRATLVDALAAGGTTLEDGGFVDADGEGGYFALSLQVYGREGEPCHHCGATVVREMLGGRSIYYCRRCQR
jgi:formamidopyrimidine-DNA glycosylase